MTIPPAPIRDAKDKIRLKYLNRPATIPFVELRERFLKIYSNLPLGIRREIVLVVDGEPITWNVAYVEVFNDTKKANAILKKLKGLDII